MLFCTLTEIDGMVLEGTKKGEDKLQGQLVLLPNEKEATLEVRNKERILSLKIYESDAKIHTGIVTYGHTITLKLATRNLVNEVLKFEIWKDPKGDNYTDDYSSYDTLGDENTKEEITLTIDEYGTGEVSYYIPDSLKKGYEGDARPQYFYFKRKFDDGTYGDEFPRSYYIKNIGKNSENKQKSIQKTTTFRGRLSPKEEVHKRIQALMLKVADVHTLNNITKIISAAILGDEVLNQVKDPLVKRLFGVIEYLAVLEKN